MVVTAGPLDREVAKGRKVIRHGHKLGVTSASEQIAMALAHSIVVHTVQQRHIEDRHDDSLAAIASLSLSHLHLAATDITDSGLTWIARMPHLETLKQALP